MQLKELLLPAILKWADYSEEYRKDNQLVYGHHAVIDKLCFNDKVTRKCTLTLISRIIKFECLLTESYAKVYVRNSLFRSKEQKLPAVSF